ncbi:hypothetical protein LINPERHAP1_LOCUS13172, partial [Linum perenne]
DEDPVKTILIWVRVTKLPIHYFNHVAVNLIGNTIRMDLVTSKDARGYVRVCVEVDLTKPLLGKYIIDDREFHIKYESLENIFFCMWSLWP